MFGQFTFVLIYKGYKTFFVYQVVISNENDVEGCWVEKKHKNTLWLNVPFSFCLSNTVILENDRGRERKDMRQD